MKKKNLTRDVFRTRFLNVLRSYYAGDDTIALILKSPAVLEQAAWVLWHTVNDTEDRLAEMSQQQKENLKSDLTAGIAGCKAMERIYQNVDHKPHFAEFLGIVRGDLTFKLENFKKAAPALTQKRLGRDRDWSLVRYAKQKIEEELHRPLTYPVLADLLNAADDAGETGRKELKAEALGRCLQRLNEHRFALLKPILERLFLEKHPRASDLPCVPKQKK
ncbi:MAG TPA: hypothetical protein VMX38_06770 [Verrucomicrobiae bacterium]|nr:hypothetical protein [Verrucomicrobiae bacterium]